MKTIKKIIVKTLPVMAGYLVLGLGFGIIAEKNGYNFLWATAMSLFIYAGSMQFITIPLLVSNASFLTVTLTTLMVNARHLFYGVSMVEHYKDTKGYKPYLIYGLTDETYSLVCTKETIDNIPYPKYCFLITLFNHIYWLIGTILGVLVGSLITFNTQGIEFAMTALFITVVVDQWRSTKNHLPTIIGIFATLISLIIFGKDSFLIPSMIIILVLLLLGRKSFEVKEDKNEISNN